MTRKFVELAVQSYLRGDSSLLDLRRVLVAVAAADRATVPNDALDLTWGVDLSVAEFMAGGLTEAEFADSLRDEAGLNVQVVSNTAPTISLTSAAQTTRHLAELA